MPSNIEIKFQVEDLNSIESKAVTLADHGPELLVQTDTFFDAPAGRLKLREFENGKSELIAYLRSDSDSVRESKWSRYSTESAQQLKETLAMAVPQTVTVKKRRTLYLIGQTRVHLDSVEQLGTFVELEVVLSKEQPTEQGIRIAEDLIASLGLQDAKRVTHAYADLLADS